tara:strand:- start:38 stop:610 length:573 start_codon:yes stop_codon:yes gene_type:complete
MKIDDQPTDKIPLRTRYRRKTAVNEPRLGSAPLWHENQFWTALLIALLVGGLDLTTKWVIATIVMNPPRIIEVTSFFNLTLGFNRGVSFGILDGLGPWGPVIISTIAAGIIGFLLVWLRRVKQRGEALAIASIIGGAGGNLIDRLHDGAVTDFLDFHLGTFHWPAFNLADSSIFLGAAVLLFSSLRGVAE